MFDTGAAFFQARVEAAQGTFLNDWIDESAKVRALKAAKLADVESDLPRTSAEVIQVVGAALFLVVVFYFCATACPSPPKRGKGKTMGVAKRNR